MRRYEKGLLEEGIALLQKNVHNVLQKEVFFGRKWLLC